MKKPFYKKWWVWAIIVLGIVGIVLSPSEEEMAEMEKKNAIEVTAKPKVEKKEEKPKVRTEEIKGKVKNVVKDFNSSVSIKKIEINDHVGTEKSEDYIALVYLSFDQKNKKDTTNNLIEMYNNELGAQLAKQKDVESLVIFWEVPYHLSSGNAVKATLKRNGEEMVFEEVWLDSVLK